jgi:hypothetical protein
MNIENLHYANGSFDMEEPAIEPVALILKTTVNSNT